MDRLMEREKRKNLLAQEKSVLYGPWFPAERA